MERDRPAIGAGLTSVRQLGYLGLEVSDLAKWERFAVDVLGLAPAARREDGSLALRMVRSAPQLRRDIGHDANSK